VVIFVHVPKNAGTTFNWMLEDLHGRGSVFIARDTTEVEELKPTTRVISGHFKATKWDKDFPNSLLFSWVRNPVERICSAYYFLRRWNLEEQPNQDAEFAQRVSLLEYAECDRQQLTKQYAGKNPSKFDFIGIVEYWNSHIDVFLRTFYQGRDCEKYHVNKNAERVGSKYDIPAVVRKAMEEMTREDREVYDCVCSRWNAKNTWEKS
jgi:hypothetical protein